MDVLAARLVVCMKVMTHMPHFVIQGVREAMTEMGIALPLRE